MKRGAGADLRHSAKRHLTCDDRSAVTAGEPLRQLQAADVEALPITEVLSDQLIVVVGCPDAGKYDEPEIDFVAATEVWASLEGAIRLRDHCANGARSGGPTQ